VTAPAIVAEGLVKRFGRAAALRDVGFALPRGETLAVLGANGAGKSTLLRLLAGLARPTAGRLEVGGLAPGDRRARARLGYVGHATLLYPALTARENLIFAARLHALADAADRADAGLAREGLAAVAARRAGDFSRGMAQRLAIARGLIHDPPIVLLDEPFTGLDPRAALHLERRLEALRAEGRSVVWVTHEIDRALRGCDRALVLARGRVVWEAQGASLSRGALAQALDAGADAP
jgi:heme exporter protein A